MWTSAHHLRWWAEAISCIFDTWQHSSGEHFYNLLRRLFRRTFATQIYDNAWFPSLYTQKSCCYRSIRIAIAPLSISSLYVRADTSITCYAGYFAVHLLRKYTTMLGFLPHFIYPYRVFVKENFSQKIRAVLRLLSIPVDTAYFLSLFINHKRNNF